MAWALQFDGVDDYALLGSGIAISSTDDFSIFINSPLNSVVDFSRPLGGTNLADQNPRVLIFSNNRVRLTSDSGVNREWFVPYDITSDTFEFVRVSGNLDLYINGSLQSGGFTSNTDSFDEFKTIGGNFGTTTKACKLINIKININGGDVLNLSPDASDHSGSTDQPILIDTIGGNNATGVNFSSYDPNVWVNLGGGVTRLSRDISLVTGFSQRLVHDTTINTALLERKSNDVTLSTSLLERKSNDTLINTGLLARLTRDTEIEFSLLARLSRTTQIQTALFERKSRDYDVASSLLERKVRNANIVTALLNRLSNDIDIATGMLGAKSRGCTISFALLERKENSVVIQFSIEGDKVPRVQLTPKAIPTVQLAYLADEAQVVQITPITPVKIQLQ